MLCILHEGLGTFCCGWWHNSTVVSDIYWNNAKWTRDCISMATFSVFITFVTLPILCVKSDFIPHREHLMHMGFLWGTNWIFVYYDSPRPRSPHNLFEPKGIGPLGQLTMYKQYKIFSASTTVPKRCIFGLFMTTVVTQKHQHALLHILCLSFSIHIINERC